MHRTFGHRTEIELAATCLWVEPLCDAVARLRDYTIRRHADTGVRAGLGEPYAVAGRGGGGGGARADVGGRRPPQLVPQRLDRQGPATRQRPRTPVRDPPSTSSLDWSEKRSSRLCLLCRAESHHQTIEISVRTVASQSVHGPASRALSKQLLSPRALAAWVWTGLLGLVGLVGLAYHNHPTSVTTTTCPNVHLHPAPCKVRLVLRGRRAAARRDRAGGGVGVRPRQAPPQPPSHRRVRSKSTPPHPPA